MHSVSLLVLLMLDAYQRLRKVVSRAFLRSVVVLLSLGLLAMVITSLFALRQVTRSVESLVGDAMVGLESSVAMRAAVRETQLDLLRLQLTSERRLTGPGMAEFQANMTKLLQDYRAGIFEGEDAANARRIESNLGNYLAALEPVIDNPRPEPDAIRFADAAARELVDAVETAYQFNRLRVRLSADQAGSSAKHALNISKRLWWSFGIFTIFVALSYLAYRWLALPEENES